MKTGRAKLSELLALRLEAEKVLKERQSDTASIPSESEMLRLLYELEVHQIELELQNNELLLAKNQAELAVAEYSELYDFAPYGYLTLSPAGEIIRLNLNGAKMLGKDPSKLKGGLFGFYVTDETKPIFNLFLSQAFSSNLPEVCELKILTGGGLPNPVYLTGIVKAQSGQCLVTMTDITGPKLL